jgi:hypothetical protein
MSGSGKTYVSLKVARMLPEEARLLLTYITPQGLFNPDVDLRHVAVIAGERSQRTDHISSDFTRVLRELQSTGSICKSTPYGLFKAEGPISFVETTTLKPTHIFDEDLNRCLILYTDTSSEQTRRILEARARRVSGGIMADQEAILLRHQAMQRTLRPHNIIIPFASVIADTLLKNCPNNVVIRRIIEQVFAMIMSVTLLYQLQHDEDAREPLSSTLAEYAIARGLLLSPLENLLGPPPSRKRIDKFELLRQYVGEEEFDTGTVIDVGLHRSRKGAGALLEMFEKAGAVRQVKESEGNRGAVWKLTGRYPGGQDLLPAAEEVARALETQKRTP